MTAGISKWKDFQVTLPHMFFTSKLWESIHIPIQPHSRHVSHDLGIPDMFPMPYRHVRAWVIEIPQDLKIEPWCEIYM